MGPLLSSPGYTYIFTIVDRTTRWPEAVPLSATAAADCAQALLVGWMRCFGVPSTITSNRGPQFTSSLRAALCNLLSIKHSPTTAYHPQANGLVERFHWRLKDALRPRAAGPAWAAHLPWVMLGIRTAWREEGYLSPAEAVFGSQPLLLGQFLDTPEPPTSQFLQDFRNLLANHRPPLTSHHSKPAPEVVPEDLLLARHVLVRRDGITPPLTPIYYGPYLVLERSLRFFKLQMGNRTDNVSTLLLKACKLPPDISIAQPPRRGWPPTATPLQKPKKTTPTHSCHLSPSPARRQPSSCLQRCLHLRCLHLLLGCTSPAARPAAPARQPATPSASSTAAVLDLGGPVGDDTSRRLPALLSLIFYVVFIQ